MALPAGAMLGRYEIVSPIGVGGMGEVYKARDTQLGRMVAVKVSQERFSERFGREAKAVAALNHPHVCQLYDVGPNYLVMEYVEGEPLKGPLSLDVALKYAAQICEALDAAHRKGIAHRDLKPGNILVTKSAGVKLLDFGLARIDGGPDATLTIEGAVMGTPAYMSPEQWEGKPGDARSDIYAFGCVLHEMLTGQRVSPQRTPVEPASLESVVRTCLEKEPDDRWQAARDLKSAMALIASPAVGAAARAPRNERIAWIAALALAASAALYFALRPAPAPSAGEVVRLTVLPPEGAFLTGQSNSTVPVPVFALSPSGRSIAFTAAKPGGIPSLFVRPLAAVTARRLPGTEDATFPFWSPDEQWIGFFAGGMLKKIPAAGGPSQAITEAPDGRGGSWGPGDVILFSPGAAGIMRVSASGGTVAPVTELDASQQEGSHRFPEFLPDGNHFLFALGAPLWTRAACTPVRLTPRPGNTLFAATPTAFIRHRAICSTWTGTH
jgi:predicted Ser/Thr protein kinase